MELRPRENSKDRKERRQLYWRKVAALTGTSGPPTKGTSIHPQVYKEGRFSLDPQWFHRILDLAGDEFQPQWYPSADPRSTTKVKRPGKRAGVWVNTPKGGAAVAQGLNRPWHDDTIFVMCLHKFLQQVAEKAIWEGGRGIMIVPRHKNKEWFWGLGEVTVDWWDSPHDALCFRDEGGTPRSPGKLGARVMPWGVIKKGWDRLISRIHMLIPLLKIIGTGRVVAPQLGPKTFEKPQRKPNLMRPHVTPPLADP